MAAGILHTCRVNFQKRCESAYRNTRSDQHCSIAFETTLVAGKTGPENAPSSVRCKEKAQKKYRRYLRLQMASFLLYFLLCQLQVLLADLQRYLQSLGNYPDKLAFHFSLSHSVYRIPKLEIYSKLPPLHKFAIPRMTSQIQQ